MRSEPRDVASRETEVARVLARLEDTAWLTAQAISVSRRSQSVERRRKTARASAAMKAAPPSARLDPTAHALLDALPLPVLWLDPHGTVAHCNAIALVRLGAPLLGLAWRELLATRLATQSEKLQVHSNAFRNGQLVVLSPVAQDTGDPAERRREQQLIRLGRVSAGLAHQLRTPIAATQLYLDLAASSGQASYLEQAQSSLDALTHHCESVLTLARGELRRERNVTVGQLLTLLQRQVRVLRGTLTISGECVFTDATLECNPHLLAGALLNLVDNALRASPSATAWLELECVDGQLNFCVRDDGPGIPAALRARLGQWLPSSRAEGSGFGLAMANMIVEAHGGRVHIETPSNGGTCVRVSVPTETN